MLGILLTGTYAIQRKPPCPRKPKNIIPEIRRSVYAKGVELRRQGKTHMEVCEPLNRLGYRTRTGKTWQHPGSESSSCCSHLAARADSFPDGFDHHPTSTGISFGAGQLRLLPDLTL